MMKGRKPHFIEVFLPNLSSNRLKVPSKFVEHLGDRKSGSLSLTGPSGNIWQVDLFEYSGHLFFRDGWPTFVKDHSIQCGDTLVFRYDGNLRFTVKIFDETSCEKDEAFLAHCTQGASECDDNLRKKRERDTEASLVKSDSEKKMRGSWVPVHEDSLAVSKKSKNKCLKSMDAVMNEHDTGTENTITTCETTVVLAMAAPDGFDALQFHNKKITPNSEKSWKKKQMPEKQNTPSISKFIEERAAHYFSSTFPYFVRVMSYSNIKGNSTLKIPTQFSTSHLPNSRIQVTLMNLNGDCWTVNSIPTIKRHTRMHTLCGGWIGFARANGVKIEDVCIFELVDELKLRVRILRLGLEGLDYQIGSSFVDTDGVRSGERCFETIEDVTPDVGVNSAEDLVQINEGLDCSSPSSFGVHDDSTSELLLCDAGNTMSYHTIGDNQVDLQVRHTTEMQPTPEKSRDFLSFTSPYPSFTKVIMSSNVSGSCALAVPRKFAADYLPSSRSEVVLRNLNGASWNVTLVRYGLQPKFCSGWKSFAQMNNVKVGDMCVFELLEERVFQVRVFEDYLTKPVCADDENIADDSGSIESTQCGSLSERVLQMGVFERIQKEPEYLNDEIIGDDSTDFIQSTQFGVESET
ncbi:unnamed protein product [Amaranthus hypochondriacus]